MKPPAFDYLAAHSAQEAVEMLAQLGSDARILAGGQSLMAVLNMRLAQPSALIDISSTADLNYVRLENDHLVVGAAATQGRVEWREDLAAEVPLLAQVFPYISHFQVRNRGTVCGSVAHADPSAELPLVLVALEGEVVLRNKKKRRIVTAVDFFQGMLTTARQPDELLEAVRFPLAVAEQKIAFTEFSVRHGDFAMASVAAIADEQRIRLTVGGVADRPVAREWERLSSSEVDDALNEFAWDLQAQDDHHASARYRRHLVRQLGKKVISEVSDV